MRGILIAMLSIAMYAIGRVAFATYELGTFMWHASAWIIIVALLGLALALWKRKHDIARGFAYVGIPLWGMIFLFGFTNFIGPVTPIETDSKAHKAERASKWTAPNADGWDYTPFETFYAGATPVKRYGNAMLQRYYELRFKQLTSSDEEATRDATALWQELLKLGYPEDVLSHVICVATADAFLTDVTCRH